MILSKKNIQAVAARDGLILPAPAELELPEKVLQFGTGVLLRGLPDHMISMANSKQIFNGRIVVVKSTGNGDTDAFAKQNSLYTLCVRGVEKGEKIAYNHVISSISRVLSASGEWEEILQCAANPEMEIIISNTTEVGISMVKDNVHASPPQSFPGKLLAFLYHRFKIFNGDPEKGMVIIPTELIPDNADKLLAIVLEQAHVHGLEIAFIDWLENSNHFCNSLVDRIVPGKFNKDEQLQNEQELGFEDELMIMSESYALWVIQTDSEKVRSVLSFAQRNSDIVLTPDIDKFRELKIRLLNGSHTFTCGLAVMAGFQTVKEAMADSDFSAFIQLLMNEEIVSAITGASISEEEAKDFVAKVLDRYRNPFIEHQWISICMQYSSKMNMRNLPIMLAYQKRNGTVPALMSLGMASHILFMRTRQKADGKFYGNANGKEYLVTDDHAAFYHDTWNETEATGVVEKILSNTGIWQTDLGKSDGFLNEVNYWLTQLLEKGVKETLKSIQTKIPVSK